VLLIIKSLRAEPTPRKSWSLDFREIKEGKEIKEKMNYFFGGGAKHYEKNVSHFFLF
jgi:hypothetical protein